ncbi:ArnT family glycosyltransferase [Antarcticimicrobium luteum]|uniref:Glycosyl transferase n=1 Tax=Antarcticimicrobium luteum TaxID=2547397 RepID=A0A4R5UQN0_9RHOB|nr:glycosyltransferase family 39 protein [Antarcticimicrobium luteum]TDK41364.1 glycosyl transferase [Antarcticimicrobium luteum]
MLKNAPRAKAPDPLWTGVAVIAAITLYRVVMLGFSSAELFVDESQYWQWGQELDWGYYSKPPLIGWVLRAFNELSGSDSTFWVRLPGVLFQATTALILIGAAREVTDRRAATMVGVAYVTLPVVAVGALLISTDSILLPFFAGALWLYLTLARSPSAPRALALGLCLGLGMLAKYAAIYFVIGAGIGAALLPPARIAWRDAALAALAFLLVIAPNLVWNLQNDLTTLSHTADNVDWVRRPGVHLNPQGAVEFLLAQFMVMGPVLFGAYLLIAARSLARPDWQPRWLVWMSAPTLVLVTGQALLSKAYANWAVTAVAAALLLVVPVLWHRARMWLWAGLALNLAATAFLPFAATQATNWTRASDGRLLMRRYVGQQAMSARILEEARKQGVSAVVSGNRHLLADLFHAAKGSGIHIYAVPMPEHPPHFYAQKHPYPADRRGSFLFATLGDTPPCPGAPPVATWKPGPGIFAPNTLSLFLRDTTCWPAAD